MPIAVCSRGKTAAGRRGGGDQSLGQQLRLRLLALWSSPSNAISNPRLHHLARPSVTRSARTIRSPPSSQPPAQHVVDGLAAADERPAAVSDQDLGCQHRRCSWTHHGAVGAGVEQATRSSTCRSVSARSRANTSLLSQIARRYPWRLGAGRGASGRCGETTDMPAQQLGHAASRTARLTPVG